MTKNKQSRNHSKQTKQKIKNEEIVLSSVSGSMNGIQSNNLCFCFSEFKKKKLFQYIKTVLKIINSLIVKEKKKRGKKH